MLSDEALYQQLLGGDLGAFDRLYERYERHLFGFIRKQLDDPHEAEDVLHEAFLAVLRERASRREANSFRAWVFGVARNLCRNRQRSRQRSSRALEAVACSPPDASLDPGGALESRQASDALRQAVTRLPGTLAELFQLRAAGLSYEEMAQVLDVPVGTVKSRMHEMVGRLREEVHPWTAS
ncbi:MAG: RNA polymerase sigma factor [Myxococcaceae bacterium]